MNKLLIRRRTIMHEEIFHEGGPEPENSLFHAAIMTVIKNPFAGKFHYDIADFMEQLNPLGEAMAAELLDLLGGDPEGIESYGKGAIVGTAGELEHGALWHVPGGLAMRAKLGDVQAMVPSTKKVGAMGSYLDLPLVNTRASFVRSHYDTLQIGTADAPKSDEIALILGMGTGARIHARVGGLRIEDVIGEDGLR